MESIDVAPVETSCGNGRQGSEWPEMLTGRVLMHAGLFVPLDEVDPAPELRVAGATPAHDGVELPHHLGVIDERDFLTVGQPAAYGVRHGAQPVEFGSLEADLVAAIQHVVRDDAAHGRAKHVFGFPPRGN